MSVRSISTRLVSGDHWSVLFRRCCFPLVENYCRPKQIDNYGFRLEWLLYFLIDVVVWSWISRWSKVVCFDWQYVPSYAFVSIGWPFYYYWCCPKRIRINMATQLTVSSRHQYEIESPHCIIEWVTWRTTMLLAYLWGQNTIYCSRSSRL